MKYSLHTILNTATFQSVFRRLELKIGTYAFQSNLKFFTKNLYLQYL